MGRLEQVRASSSEFDFLFVAAWFISRLKRTPEFAQHEGGGEVRCTWMPVHSYTGKVLPMANDIVLIC